MSTYTGTWQPPEFRSAPAAWLVYHVTHDRACTAGKHSPNPRERPLDRPLALDPQITPHLLREDMRAARSTRLLITGATGFIGSRLALHAHQQHFAVVAVGLTNTAAEQMRLAELRAAGVDVLLGALQDAAFVNDMVRGCDAVIHLAAAQHEANVPDSYFHEVNVEGTRRLLEACIDAKVPRFIYGSTIGVHGSADGGTLDETSPLQPENAYARSKLDAERLVNTYADRIATTIIRISETYGPGDFRLLKLFRAVGRGLFVMLGSGTNSRQLIHVRDLVRGLLLVTQHPAAAGETFIFAGSEVLTTQQVVAQVAAALQSPVPRRHVPLWPFVLVARAMEATLAPFGIQPPLHRRRLDFFVKSFVFSTGKAKARLGFEPSISFAQGAQETAGWYRSHRLLKGTGPNPAQPGPASIEPDVPLAVNASRGWQYSDILEYTNDAIVIWEMDGAGILYWNRAAEQLYGYSRQQALGQTTHTLLRTQLQGGVDGLEAKLSRYGVWAGELRHTTRDGRPIIVQGRLALMSQHNGRWLVLEVNRELIATNRDDAQHAVESHLHSLRSPRSEEPAAITP